MYCDSGRPGVKLWIMSEELFEAIEKHDTSQVLALLAAGADPNACQDGEIPEMLARQATRKPAWHWGWSPLHQAVCELPEGGGFEVVLALLERGADVNTVSVTVESTPLMLAVLVRHLAAVEALLKAGADPNVRNLDGESPLRACVEEGDLTMAALLLNAGAAKTIDDWGLAQFGYTALGIAASQLNLPMIKLLLDAGADPNAQDDDYSRAYDRLPRRDESNSQQWAAAFELLWVVPDRKP